MFKSIDMFKLLKCTFVRDNKDYQFKKFANIFIVLELQDKTPTSLDSRDQEWTRFEDLIRPGNGWKIKTKTGTRMEEVYGFLKQCLKQAQRCLKGKSLLRKESLKAVLEKASDYKELIAADYEGLITEDSKVPMVKEPRNQQDKEIDELLKMVKEDLAFLDGFGTHTTDVQAKINEKEPFAGITIKESSYKKLAESNDIGSDLNEFARQLEKDYQRSEPIIRKDREGDIFPFLKLEIENYIKTSFPPRSNTESTEPKSFDMDIKIIPWPASPRDQGIISQLTQEEPNLIYVEKDKTIISYMAIDYIKSKEYILCQLVFSSNYFQVRGLLKSESKAFRVYLVLLANVLSGLREFIEKYPIYNRLSLKKLPLTHKQLIDLLNNLDAYCNKLVEVYVSIPALLFELIDLGWDPKSLDKLFQTTFNHYKEMISHNFRMEPIIDDFIQIKYGISKREIRFQNKKLDELTESLEVFARQVVNKDCHKGEELISIVFNILQRFASDLIRVESTYQKVNELRADIESTIGDDFFKVAFKIFKKENWNGSYHSLNEQMRSQIKKLAKRYLKRRIDSLDDVNRMLKQYKTLRSEELNIKFEDEEMDNIIEPIVQFAGENKTIPDLIDRCHKTIEYLASSYEKSLCFGKLRKIKYQNGLFDDNKHLLVFLNVYLDRNWDETKTKLVNIEKDIHRIFLEAIGSLLEEKDAKSKIKSNLNILKDINLEVQDNLKTAILKNILKRSTIYRITGKTLTILKEKNIPAVILVVVLDLKEQEYTSEEELIRVLGLQIGRKLNGLKKVKINKEELEQYKNSIPEHAKFFIKNAERLGRYLGILTVVYGDQQEKVSTFEKFSKMRMSHSNLLDEHFLQAAFRIFTASSWENNKIPGGLEKEIKKVFSKSFNDANITNDDVEENLRILTEDLGFLLTEEERKALDENWREKIKIMIDRTYDKNKTK